MPNIFLGVGDVVLKTIQSDKTKKQYIVCEVYLVRREKHKYMCNIMLGSN